MPEATSTVWTCSRCGVTETLVHGGGRWAQPKNWLRAFFVTPPRASAADCLTLIGDLCNPCGGLLVDFVHGRNIEQEMARALELAHLEKLVGEEPYA